MKRITITTLSAFLFLMLAGAVSAQEKFSKVVTEADRWDTMEFTAPAECGGTPEECAVKMLGEAKVDVGESPEFSVYQLGDVDGKNTTVVFVSHLIQDDESPELGKLYRLVLDRQDAADTTFSLNELGRMFQCIDGPAGWRKTACQ